MNGIPFAKMHGCGNDFILVDAFETPPPSNLEALARQLNDRRFGIGGDGLILVLPGARLPFRMRMFNPDGSEAEMCGNGIRCFAKFVHERGYALGPEIPVETGAGDLRLLLEGEQVRVDMGLARTKRGEIPMAGPAQEEARDIPVTLDGRVYRGFGVSMGNPHFVIPVEDVSSVPLSNWGPRLERNFELFPQGVNVHFVQVLSRGEIVQRTWERGAGATLACGTGACASVVACSLSGRTDPIVLVHLPGGDLRIEVEESRRVWMIGPAEAVYEGVWTDELGRLASQVV
jgi:diaminopimelate epimerase